MLDELIRYVIHHWWTAFILTLVVETPLYLLLSQKISTMWRRVIGAVLTSCITHPLLWYVWRRLFDDYTLYVISGEVMVAIIESFVFFAVARPIALRRAAAASLIANGASYATGLALYRYLTW